MLVVFSRTRKGKTFMFSILRTQKNESVNPAHISESYKLWLIFQEGKTTCRLCQKALHALTENCNLQLQHTELICWQHIIQKQKLEWHSFSTKLKNWSESCSMTAYQTNFSGTGNQDSRSQFSQKQCICVRSGKCLKFQQVCLCTLFNFCQAM